jgi:nicotinamide-nucleotide amidase
MNAEIIAIGDEITTGQRLDTNSQWLAERLTELGLDVVYHTTVADELAANVDVFRIASQRADVVVATGGLGPTADDLTREALAQMLGTQLVLDTASLAHIEQLFASRGRTMPERNQAQALFPQGSEPLPNEHGTAPGIFAQVARDGRPPCRLFALPGVPAEMKPMFADLVAPRIAGDGAPRVICHRRIHCFGLGESHVEAKLPDLIKRGREPRVGITASGATITLRITAAGESQPECRALMKPTVDLIYSALGDLIFGEEDDELQTVLVRLLQERGQHVATAEVASAGLMAEWLSAADPSRGVFGGGIVCPSQQAGAVDLAREARRQFATDWGLAVGPIVESVDSGQTTGPAFAVAIVGAGVEVIDWFGNMSHPSLQAVRNAKIGLNTLRLALVRGQL